MKSTTSTFIKITALIFFTFSLFFAQAQTIEFREDFGALFEEVQMKGIFEDSKTFPDCLPKKSVREIMAAYNANKTKFGFNLKGFVLENFSVPQQKESDYQTDAARPIDEHIEQLWEVLSREPDDETIISSLIPLPSPYVVPGGRFREVYYWDSYFTMLGLQVSGRTDLIRGMVENFAHLINTLGFIPNGNRSYYNTRSQPPFFSLMVKVLAEEEGNQIFEEFLAPMEKEYEFWMNGAPRLTVENDTYRRVVLMPDGSYLNRYWDDSDAPRTESYKEDVELAEANNRNHAQLYRDLRAACESGWDFSGRWLRDGTSLGTIHTTEIIPVDLNALLYHLERTLEMVYEMQRNAAKEGVFKIAADARKAAIRNYCWDEEAEFYTDYDFVAEQLKTSYSLAGLYPLYFRVASKAEARKVAKKAETDFLKPGGAVATLVNTGQQWDAPNGWPPLQWITIKGLEKYKKKKLSAAFAEAWIKNNKRVYENTNKMVEKYNVEDITLKAGGGEYDLQDGFGWSNGVLLRLLEEQKK